MKIIHLYQTVIKNGIKTNQRRRSHGLDSNVELLGRLSYLLIGVLPQELPNRLGYFGVFVLQQRHQQLASLRCQQLFLQHLGKEARHVVDELGQKARNRMSLQRF